jgi:hypothetical protein
MRRFRRFAVGAAAALAACGGGGGSGGGGSQVLAVVGPASDVDVSRGSVVEVSYVCDDAGGDARTRIVLDRDGVLATTADAIVVATDLPETGALPSAVGWDTTGIEPGVFTVFAVATDDDGNESTARADGIVAVRNVAFARESRAGIRNVATLPDGSCVVVGSFAGSATFGVGEPGETTLVAAGGEADIDVFLARFAPDGTLAWARRAGGPNGERCDAVAAHPSGELVAAGIFFSSTTLGAGEPGETTLASEDGGFCGFVAAFTADGRLRWAARVEGDAVPSAVARFDDGSCAVAGSFTGTATFGPGEPGATVLVAAEGVGTPGRHDAFLARFGPQGGLLWAKRAGGGDNDFVSTLVALEDGSCVAGGVYRDLATFGPGEPGETVLGEEGQEGRLYVARLRADGTLEWVVTAEPAYAPDAYPYSTVSGIARGPDGSLLVTGQAIGDVWFGRGEPTQALFAGTGSYGTSFVARYEADGAFAWVRRVVHSDLGSTVGIAPAEGGGFTVGGTMQGETTFDPDGVAEVLTSASDSALDVFVARFDADGALLWARRAGGTGEERVASFAAFRDGSVAVGGSFQDRAVFGEGGEREATLGPAVPQHGFLARWNADGDF